MKNIAATSLAIIIPLLIPLLFVNSQEATGGSGILLLPIQ
jgi:hypothetical protein